MAHVNGIGGFFFKAQDPELLSRWYDDHLGITAPPQSYDASVWVQDAGPTVFAPFGPEQAESPYLGAHGWGVNLRVDDLDAVVDQLRGAGIDVNLDTEL